MEQFTEPDGLFAPEEVDKLIVALKAVESAALVA